MTDIPQALGEPVSHCFCDDCSVGCRFSVHVLDVLNLFSFD